MQRTLKREVKVLEMVKREAIGTSDCDRLNQPQGVGWCRFDEGSLDLRRVGAWPALGGALWPGRESASIGTGREMGRWKVGGHDYVLVVTAAGTRYRLADRGVLWTFQRAASGSGDALPVGWRRWGQLAVPVDRQPSPRRYHQLVRDADEMVSIDPSCNADQGV